jgi:hypothetical protein
MREDESVNETLGSIKIRKNLYIPEIAITRALLKDSLHCDGSHMNSPDDKPCKVNIYFIAHYYALPPPLNP